MAHAESKDRKEPAPGAEKGKQTEWSEREASPVRTFYGMNP